MTLQTSVSLEVCFESNIEIVHELTKGGDAKRHADTSPSFI